MWDQYRDPKVNSSKAKKSRYNLFRIYESIALNNFHGYDVINKQSLKLTDLVRWCQFKPVNVRSFRICNDSSTYFTNDNVNAFDCERIKQPIPIVYDGRKCFVYFSEQSNILPGYYKAGKTLNRLHAYSKNETNLFIANDNQNGKFGILQDLKQMKFEFNPYIEMQINMHNHIWDFIGEGSTTITGSK